MELVTIDAIHNDLSPALSAQGVAELLPEHMTLEQFSRVAATALHTNTKLQTANKQSLISSLVKCAKDGLMPDGREAALVMFKDQAQYMPMVDGVLKRARQSNQVEFVTGKVVCSNDEFDYWFDENGEHIIHKPAFDNRGHVRFVYGCAKLTTGELVVEVMTLSDIEKVKAVSKTSSYESSPWKKWPDRMAIKSALHRLCKRLPVSSDMMQVFDADTSEREINPRAEKEVSSLNELFAPEPIEPLNKTGIPSKFEELRDWCLSVTSHSDYHEIVNACKESDNNGELSDNELKELRSITMMVKKRISL